MGWSANSNARSGNPVLTQNGTGAAPDPCYFWGNTGPGGNGYNWDVLTRIIDQSEKAGGCCMAVGKSLTKEATGLIGASPQPTIDQSLTEPDWSLLASVRDDRFKQLRIWVSV